MNALMLGNQKPSQSAVVMPPGGSTTFQLLHLKMRRPNNFGRTPQQEHYALGATACIAEYSKARRIPYHPSASAQMDVRPTAHPLKQPGMIEEPHWLCSSRGTHLQWCSSHSAGAACVTYASPKTACHSASKAAATDADASWGSACRTGCFEPDFQQVAGRPLCRARQPYQRLQPPRRPAASPTERQVHWSLSLCWSPCQIQ